MGDKLKKTKKIAGRALLAFFFLLTVFSIWQEKVGIRGTEWVIKNDSENNGEKSEQAGDDGFLGFLYRLDDTGIFFRFPEELERIETSSRLAGGQAVKEFDFRKRDGKTLVDRKIEYGVPCDGEEAGCVNISREKVDALINEPSCDDFVGLFKEEAVRSVFSEDSSICRYVKKDDLAIFYGVGKRDKREGYPYIGSSIFVLARERGALLDGEIVAGLNDDLDSFYSLITREAKNYALDYGTAPWKEVYEKMDQEIKRELSGPSKLIETKLEEIGKVAETIVISNR